jgi:hypothetical protein
VNDESVLAGMALRAGTLIVKNKVLAANEGIDRMRR